ncbi:hypothetical protein FM111_04485 [Brevundimonas diminuta 3F5N]|uniref:Uncharacterized protein n=1 Tax=Brevundimonas diminuta 3F5N TaxID=1255603 RepID=A0A1R4FFT9_BREDI|nr:hypothetical protein [Brevundimonas diminuta]SJM54703.1 hypothetical protein FM111_04485 [Brevundimonas diminuta 3F5N]
MLKEVLFEAGKVVAESEWEIKPVEKIILWLRHGATNHYLAQQNHRQSLGCLQQ